MKRSSALAQQGMTKVAADKAWKSARSTAKIEKAITVLVMMNHGSRRCMYCEHDRGGHIDHFCPRAHNVSLTFAWDNWLWACAECNSNYKRDQFPAGLLDPSTNGYQFETHFEFQHATGAFDLKTSQARASAPVFGLNDTSLQLSRVAAFNFYESLICRFAKFMVANDVAQAARIRAATKIGPHPSILATIKRWYNGPGRTILDPDCVAAINNYPEILTW